MKIHLTAIVHPGAELADDVDIGPYCQVGEQVRIGSGTRLQANVIIEGPTEIGENNLFYPFSSIGAPPQDLKYRGEPSRLVIGNRNTIREFVTMNRGTEGGGMLTCCGDDNLLMAYVHVAHDCRVGNRTIFGNAATLAGHVLVEDGSAIGAFCGVHQFCRIGVQAFIGGYSVITRDALPYMKTVGTRGEAKTFGVNTIGLERLGLERDRIEALKSAYRLLFHSEKRVVEAIEELRAQPQIPREVETLIRFIETSDRGFIR